MDPDSSSLEAAIGNRNMGFVITGVVLLLSDRLTKSDKEIGNIVKNEFIEINIAIPC